MLLQHRISDHSILSQSLSVLQLRQLTHHHSLEPFNNITCHGGPFFSLGAFPRTWVLALVTRVTLYSPLLLTTLPTDSLA